VDGRQLSFRVEGVWISAVAPAANMAVDVYLDDSGSLLRIVAVDPQQIAREKMDQLSAAAQEHGKQAAEFARKGIGSLTGKMGEFAQNYDRSLDRLVPPGTDFLALHGRPTKLGVAWEPSEAERDYNVGRSTQIPLNPVVRVKARFSRRLREGKQELVVVRSAGVRSFFKRSRRS
jgi:hypothetical protein